MEGEPEPQNYTWTIFAFGQDKLQDIVMDINPLDLDNGKNEIGNSGKNQCRY